MTDPSKLKDGFTPAAYGLDLDYPGRLAKAASALTAGSSLVRETATLTDGTWTKYYGRVWKLGATSAKELLYNAPGYYTGGALPQDRGYVDLSIMSSDPTTFIAFGGDAMFAGNATHGLMIPNAASRGGNYIPTQLDDRMACAAYTNAMVVNQALYVSNSRGLWAWDGREIVEVFRPHRATVQASSAGVWQTNTLTLDFQKARIIGDTKWVFDTLTGRIFDYTTSGFLWTSRTMVADGWKPFTVKAVSFDYESVDGNDAWLKFQIKHDKGWEPATPVRVTIPYAEDTRARYEYMLEDWVQARQFAIRIVDMSTNFRIKQVDILTDLAVEQGSWTE
jgi:hypothetical protein